MRCRNLRSAMYSARKTTRREICDTIKEAGMDATIICVNSMAKPSREKKNKKILLNKGDGLIGDLPLNRA